MLFRLLIIHSDTQIKRRQIIYNIVITDKVVEITKAIVERCVLLKVDSLKAYDMVN